ncbi:MAG: NAD(P)/FAD-dependent oxidoreductase [Pelatocladus maniniholoensis HA4357-MV3]|uniref:NAD(P)/FAD-dependent oxidoreductase n=1 Tax=Pelatocladus maniniholoensis HA4357-MV3 TaxID=1117104 RepID=A0A9E3LRN3_9NOST|nr:NAD(P)/FAD-dependent oxidoreductase [Pelatocladus maniniholoensis HA4357-MV3]
MTVDYDVVIIGGSFAGRSAALMATQLKAKVALVEPKIDYGFIHHQVLSEVGRLSQGLSYAAQLGIGVSKPPDIFYPTGVYNGTINSSTEKTEEFSQQDPFTNISLGKSQTSVEWSEALLYARGISSNLEEQNSPAVLAAQGVDVIIGKGQFQASPDLVFVVNNRSLRARIYLLASGSVPVIPDIEGLQKTGFLTLSEIWQSLASSTPPKNWAIIGGIPQSIEVAQTLVRLGCSVTLVTHHPSIIRHTDPEVAQILQAQLEAEGVHVLTNTTVTQVRLIEDKKWLQAGNKAIETDEILVAIAQQPNIESLNLAAVGVKWRHQHLVVNEKLQTTNHQIYACGDVIGGYEFPHIANYEARIALKNALFLPLSKVNYYCVPWGVFSHPRLAQVGWTETQAKRQYGKNEIIVLRQYFKTVTAAQIQQEITGICKLIVRRHGEILGAVVLGVTANELINIIALAITQKIKINQIANLAPIFPSFSEILEQTARQWHQQKLQNNTKLQDLLESFFHFRRDWKI